jgi:addiction module HigA family antidote
MKTKPVSIPRKQTKVPKPLSNPAAAVIRDTLEHHGITRVEAARAMNISTAQLSDVIRQCKGVGDTIALRFQACFGTPGDFLIRFQARHDLQKACQSKGPGIRRKVPVGFSG